MCVKRTNSSYIVKTHETQGVNRATINPDDDLGKGNSLQFRTVSGAPVLKFYWRQRLRTQSINYVSFTSETERWTSLHIYKFTSERQINCMKSPYWKVEVSPFQLLRSPPCEPCGFCKSFYIKILWVDWKSWNGDIQKLYSFIDSG